MSQAALTRAVGMVAGVAMCVVTALVTASGTSSEHADLEAAARALIVGAPIAVGIHLTRRPPFERFGWMLVASSAGWFLSSLSGSSDAVLYSVGRVSSWISEALFVCLMLAFPTGRLEATADRVIVGGIIAVSAIAFVPTALLVEHYPVPTTWSACGEHCPDNALMLVSAEPSWIEDFVRPVRELAQVALTGAGVVRVALRLRAATHLMRRMLTPVLQVATLRMALYATGFLGRGVAGDRDSDLVRVGWWLVALTIPALAIAFLVGSIRWRLFIGASVQRLAARLRPSPSREQLRLALAEAFEDPTLQLAYPDGDGWVDAAGRTLDPPAGGSGRVLTAIRADGRLVGAVAHDAALQGDRGFVDSARSAALITIECQRLAAKTTELLDELRASRTRVLAGADEERLRIQRDLHDGAQQRLVALRVRLELAAEQAAGGAADPDTLRDLGHQVDEAIEDVRSLVQGIYPTLLSSYGIVEALRSAARQLPVPSTVIANGVGRYAAEIERAVYFCCLEALQNASKHAEGATAVTVTLVDDGALRLDVQDDGRGFDVGAAPRGAGLSNMRDRVAVVGGELTVRSSAQSGTTVQATIPLRPSTDDRPPPPMSSTGGG